MIYSIDKFGVIWDTSNGDRRAIAPGDNLTAESQEVRDLAAQHWPPEVMERYKPESMVQPTLSEDGLTWIEGDPEGAAMLQAEREAKIAEQQGKQNGFNWNGVQVPVTNEDAIGAMQIKMGFEDFGMQSTRFDLSNGNSITITVSEWPAFAAAFFAKRAEFFVA